MSLLRTHVTRQRVVMIGMSLLTLELAREIEEQPARGWTLVGIIADATDPPPAWTRYLMIGPPDDVKDLLNQLQPQRVIVAAWDGLSESAVTALAVARQRGMVVQGVEEAYEALTGRIATDDLPSSAPGHTPRGTWPRLDTMLRRGLSITVALFGLLVLSPLLVIIAIAVKVDSRGPILFRHERLGLAGRRFRLLKFRTMHPVRGPTTEWVDDNHARITRVGKWLRRFRLDELPQFINILAGDMNLVGPRPHPVSTGRLCVRRMSGYSVRTTVRPGVTGWAQVRYGYANGIDEEIEKLRYDFYYIKHLSLGLDLRILLATIGVVLFDCGHERARHPRVSRGSEPTVARLSDPDRVA